jgi:hypothetical protein
MNRYRFGRSYLRVLGYLSDVEILYSADEDRLQTITCAAIVNEKLVIRSTHTLSMIKWNAELCL